MNPLTPWLAALTAFVVGAITSYPIYMFLLRAQSRQTVSEHVKEHAHKQGTPTMGGLMIFAGLAGGLGVAAALGGETVLAKAFWAPAILLVLFAGIGLLDDYYVPRWKPGSRGLAWHEKLGLQVLAALGALWMGSSSFDAGAWAIAVVLILFFSNAYNFADGMDALAGLLLVGFALGLAVLGAMLGMHIVLVWSTLLLGGILPFLYWNKPKAKIFMGDVGALPIGAVLGWMVWLLAFPGGTAAPASPMLLAVLAVLSFVMIVEIVPVALQIGAVKLLKRRIFPMTPIHHAFQKAGWPEGKVVGLFVGAQFACTLLALGIGFSTGTISSVAEKPGVQAR